MNATLSHIRAILATTPLRWQQLFDALPGDHFIQPPIAGEWSPYECLQHMFGTERLAFPVRLQALLHGQELVALDPHSVGSAAELPATPAELVAAFVHTRTENLLLFDQVQATDLDRQSRHSELGLVSVSQLLHEWAAHDLDHTMQAERALIQPFIEGCGPWRSYFVGHTYDRR